ncbi:hypothetical protein CsatB_007194 [Cannabis sativa]|uniref:Protein PAM68, chloroplastic n=2 Tax=Cannabis sativa TaxID=3483 RepID=A0A7J6HJ23_CANSA|nr:protein PAM68, chloroplastic [Cannabis sativa]KAF4388163.1 hypothetical protein G4B88_021859 [Cannabis sativa]KAF4395282.1 hypothetical protein F8388_001669 [Cannabis sativa]
MAATAVTFSWLSPVPNFNPTSYHKIAFKIWSPPTTNCLIKCLKANQYPISTTNTCNCKNQTRLSHFTPLYATLKSPKGFGPPKKSKKTKKTTSKDDDDDEDDKRDEEEEDEEGVIPEIVTNRMISRMGFTVGAPLFVGLLFFPFFYYLKVGLKIDVPTWVPFIVSFIFFGTALLGVSYGIVSSSWDPLREGSFLGWNEAKKNWPVFWQSFRGGSKRK